jgi:hypothetical protein
MTRLRVRSVLLACGLGLCVFSPALAIPAVLERVPEDVMLAVAIPAPETLQKNLADLSKAIGEPVPDATIKDLLGMGGFTGGVDATKAIAMIVLKPEAKPAGKADPAAPKEGEAAGGGEALDPMAVAETMEQRTLLLIPITSYEEMLAGFGAKPVGGGKADAITLPTGDDGFCRDIGNGYAVVGPTRALVESFTGKPGATPMAARMGKAGQTLADGSDIITLVNIEAVRPMAQDALKEFTAQAKDQAQMMGQNADAQLAMVQWLGDAVIRDTRFVTGGVKFSAAGVNMDLVASFNDDSYLGRALAGDGGNATALLSRLPAGPFLLAAALDTRSAGVRQFFSDLSTRSVAAEQQKVAQANTKLYTEADGQAAVVGFPMGGAISGLLTATVGFTAAKDPAAAVKNIRETVTVANDLSVEGVTYKTSWVEGGAKAGDKAFDVWDMKITMADAEQAGQMGAQAMQFMFGPQGGPGGYVAAAPGGVYRTYAKSTELMSRALGAAEGQNLGADAAIKAVQANLPANRAAEIYLGSRPILDLVLPFAAMAGVPVGPDTIPEKISPVGLSIAPGSGTTQMSVFLPADVMKTGIALGQAFEQMQNDMQGDGMGEEGGEKNNRREGGQPKF